MELYTTPLILVLRLSLGFVGLGVGLSLGLNLGLNLGLALGLGGLGVGLLFTTNYLTDYRTFIMDCIPLCLLNYLVQLK